MALSNAALVLARRRGRHEPRLFFLGLGWNLSYVSATTQLLDLAAPSERGRLVGFNDLLRQLPRRPRCALLGGLVSAGRGAFAARWRSPPPPLAFRARPSGCRGPVGAARVPRREAAASLQCRRADGCPLFYVMKTYSAKPGEITREWYLVDAEGQTLGRLATQIATVLRGKTSRSTPRTSTPATSSSSSTRRRSRSPAKAGQKMYYRHSGYPGGLQRAHAPRAARPPARRRCCAGP